MQSKLPFRKQEHPDSCAVACLRMPLAGALGLMVGVPGAFFLEFLEGDGEADGGGRHSVS